MNKADIASAINGELAAILHGLGLAASIVGIFIGVVVAAWVLTR
jgi:hypothetical protein